MNTVITHPNTTIDRATPATAGPMFESTGQHPLGSLLSEYPSLHPTQLVTPHCLQS